MNDHADTHVPELIPRPVLRAMVALCLATLALVSWAVLTDRPKSAMPPVTGIVAERSMILISDGVSGAVTVLSPEGAMIAQLEGEEGGFVAGVARVIDRERAMRGLTSAAPVSISRSAGGRLAITDPVTGWSADLMGFGADNATAFARLLDQQ